MMRSLSPHQIISIACTSGYIIGLRTVLKDPALEGGWGGWQSGDVETRESLRASVGQQVNECV